MKIKEMINHNVENINKQEGMEDLYCIDCEKQFDYDKLYDMCSFWNEEEGFYICTSCDEIRYKNK